MRTRIGTAFVMLAMSVAAVCAASPAGAEQPSGVLNALERDGVFIHSRRNDGIDRQALVDVVEDAGELGYRMAIILPDEPLPDLRSFVLRIQQGGAYDAVLGFGPEGEVEAELGEELGSERISSLRAVRSLAGPPEDRAALFLTELTTEPEPELPDSVSMIIRWVVYLLIGLVGAGILEMVWRRLSKRGRDNQSVT